MKQLLSKSCVGLSLAAGLLLSSSAVFAQVKIGTNPTVIGVNNSLEVEATNNKKVIVDKTTGTLKVENKPSASINDSLVTRDANGELHQISPSRLFQQQKVPVTIFQGTLEQNQNIPVIVAENTIDQRMPLTPRPGYSAGWNAVSKQFTLPTDGYYHIEVGLGCIGTGPGGPSSLVTRIWISSLNGGPFEYSYAPISSAYGVNGSLNWSGQYIAGTTINLNGYIQVRDANSPYGPPTPAVCKMGYLNITKD